MDQKNVYFAIFNQILRYILGFSICQQVSDPPPPSRYPLSLLLGVHMFDYYQYELSKNDSKWYQYTI